MIFDISDPTNPKKCGICLLDGYGDGIFVHKDICFAATGHHSGKLHNRRKYQNYDFVVPDMFKDGYGCGHGIELFDVSDPSQPQFLSRLKAPPQFFSGNDFWDVSVNDGYAYWADSYSGLFIVNIKNPHTPAYEGYYRFPAIPNDLYRTQPSIQQPCGPLSGLAVGCGYLYLASVNFGIHVVEFKPAKSISLGKQHTNISVNERKHKQLLSVTANQPQNATVVLKTNSQIHGVDFCDNNFFIAAGSESLFVLDSENFEVRNRAVAGGFCMDVKCYQNRIIVAEGSAGLSVWKLNPAGLECTARVETPQAARQVVVYDELAIAVVLLGVNKVQFWDLTEIDMPQPLACFQEKGNLYYKNIMDGLFHHQYAIVAPLKPSTSFYNLADRNSIKRKYGDIRDMCPLEDGITLYKDMIINVMAGKR